MKILVIDDDGPLRELLLMSLLRNGHDAEGASGREDAWAILRESEYDLVLLDIRLGDVDGISMLKEIRKRWPQLLVIMMTAFGRIEQAVETLKEGAFDFLEKPFSLSALEIRIGKAVKHIALQRANGLLQEEIDRHHEGLIGNDPIMREIRERIAKFSKVDMPILITGETGTGKELVARNLVKLSGRQNQPFVTINCGAIPHALMESIFFGHEKGSFTGAYHTVKGKFELADGGTMFLDEIGELPLDLQVKLLRVLEEKKFERVGGEKSISTDVWILSATHRNLEKMVAEGHFRRDLFYRLNVLAIQMPSLKDRKEDMPLLVSHILETLGRELHRELVCRPGLIEMLEKYTWPGNVRELRNVLERMAVLSEDGVLKVENLPFDLYRKIPEVITGQAGLREELESEERKKIEKALARARGNQTLAAQYLGMKRTSLQYRIRKLNLLGQKGRNGKSNG